MNVTIKRRYNRESSKWTYRATCVGPYADSWYWDGSTPLEALQSLAGNALSSCLIYAQTVQEYERSEKDGVIDYHADIAADLRKKNAALRKELKELKK